MEPNLLYNTSDQVNVPGNTPSGTYQGGSSLTATVPANQAQREVQSSRDEFCMRSLRTEVDKMEQSEHTKHPKHPEHPESPDPVVLLPARQDHESTRRTFEDRINDLEAKISFERCEPVRRNAEAILDLYRKGEIEKHRIVFAQGGRIFLSEPPPIPGLPLWVERPGMRGFEYGTYMQQHHEVYMCGTALVASGLRTPNYS